MDHAHRPNCPRLASNRFTLLSIAIGAFGAALVLGRETTSIGADSAHYVAAANSLLSGEGVLGLRGNPLVLWPPLFPLLLAAASLGIFDPVDVALPLNALLFGVTVFVVGQYLHRRLASRWLAVWGCLSSAVAVPLAYRSSQISSEALFVLLMTLVLIRADRYLTEGRFRTLVSVAVLSGLAWQTRYIGGTAPALLGPLLLFWPGVPFAVRAKRSAIYSLIAGLPMALWLLRNLVTSGAITYHPPPGDYPVPTMLQDIFDILWSWLQTGTASTGVVLIPLICILAFSAWKRSPSLQRRRARPATRPPSPSPPPPPPASSPRPTESRNRHVITTNPLSINQGAPQPPSDWRPLWLFGGFSLIYLVFFLAIVSLVVGIYLQDGVSDRLIIPIYLPLLIAGLVLLDRALQRERSAESSLIRRYHGAPRSKRQRVIVFVALTIVFLLGPAHQLRSHFSAITGRDRQIHPAGFDALLQIESETLRYAAENVVSTHVYTNAPIAYSTLLYFHIGKGRRYVPILPMERSLTGFSPPASATVIWFHEVPRSHEFEYDGSDLRHWPGMTVVRELDDGIVFEMTE